MGIGRYYWHSICYGRCLYLVMAKTTKEQTNSHPVFRGVKTVYLAQYKNHNAGELLILAFIEVGFAHNISGDCRCIRQPVIP